MPQSRYNQEDTPFYHCGSRTVRSGLTSHLGSLLAYAHFDHGESVLIENK